MAGYSATSAHAFHGLSLGLLANADDLSLLRQLTSNVALMVSETISSRLGRVEARRAVAHVARFFQSLVLFFLFLLSWCRTSL